MRPNLGFMNSWVFVIVFSFSSSSSDVCACSVYSPDEVAFSDDVNSAFTYSQQYVFLLANSLGNNWQMFVLCSSLNIPAEQRSLPNLPCFWQIAGVQGFGWRCRFTGPYVWSKTQKLKEIKLCRYTLNKLCQIREHLTLFACRTLVEI